MPEQNCPKCGTPLSASKHCLNCLLQLAANPAAFLDEDDPDLSEALQGEARTQRRPVQPIGIEAVRAAFPHLEIIERIGRGGMGTVFKARQPKLDRIVALKILSTELENKPSFTERFAQEGKMLARLNHPNIISVYDFGESGGFYYLLMGYVDGVNLREAMREDRFSPEQAIAIIPKICEALQYAHDEGVLHRDIKPANILLDTKGRVKIADFGIAKLTSTPKDLVLTQAGQVLGTPSYMAPEQMETPTRVDHRADIYSLGVVFYELLTGNLPRGHFPAPSEQTHVSADIDGIVLKALNRDREKRQQSAEELKSEITAFRQILEKSTQAQEFGTKLRIAVASLCCLVMAGVIFAVVASVLPRAPKQQVAPHQEAAHAPLESLQQPISHDSDENDTHVGQHADESRVQVRVANAPINAQPRDLEVFNDLIARGALDSDFWWVNGFITQINVQYRGLTGELDVSGLRALRSLTVADNRITKLDVSNNPALWHMFIRSNLLTELDLSDNTALKELIVYDNQLTTLDVSNNMALTNIWADRNQLTALEVTMLTGLTVLNVWNNQIASLDVSKNAVLVNLNCAANRLTSIDISNNTALTHLYIDNNQLTSLDVSNNTELEFLNVDSNRITELDISSNPLLEHLDATNNRLTSLDISNNPLLIELRAENNLIRTIDTSNNPLLTTLRF